MVAADTPGLKGHTIGNLLLTALSQLQNGELDITPIAVRDL